MSAPAPPLGMVRLIERKKQGGELSPEELRFLCDGVVAGTIPDYQVTAWLMAVYFRGMTEPETLALTQAMIASGTMMEWPDLPSPPVDKHSTGGVGDKTSLVLVPLMAAAGTPFVKMSGRGLAHTGGTLDKLESIPGFSVDLSLRELRRQVGEIGCALVGQSAELVLADGLLYALRDVTATVDSLPLIASSIMSKKLAAGARAIVLDVKYGSGALIQDQEGARELARAMVRIGLGAGRSVAAVLSSMEQPLGQTVGNALEVREAIETLHGGGPEELWALALELGVQLLRLTGQTTEPDEARARLRELRDSGAAAERFATLIRAQGGDPRVVADPSILPTAPIVEPIVAPSEGWVSRVDARTVAEAAMILGAGRRTKSDRIDHAVGVRLVHKIGAPVEGGAPLAEIHARDEATAAEARRLVAEAYELSPTPVAPPTAGYEIVEN